jgi:hypothetical protein
MIKIIINDHTGPKNASARPARAMPHPEIVRQWSVRPIVYIKFIKKVVVVVVVVVVVI